MSMIEARVIPSILSGPYSFVPPGALGAWNTAKAQAASVQVPIVVWGDSVAQGFSASNWRTKSWYGLVKARLQSEYGLAGEFISPADSTNLSSSIPASDAIWTWTTGGGPTVGENSHFFPGFQATGTTHANDNLSVTYFTAFTDFDVIDSRLSDGGAYTLLVDGVTQAGSPTWNAASTTNRVTTQYSGFSNSTHTIKLNLTTAGASIYHGGITFYPTGRSTKGLIFCKHSLLGKSSSDTTNSPGGDDSMNAMITGWAPGLFIADMGGNDCQLGTALDTYLANMAYAFQLCEQINCSIVMLIPYAGSGLTNRNKIGQYWERVMGLALAYNAAIVNVGAAIAPVAGAQWGTLHPNDTGSATMASLMLSIL